MRPLLALLGVVFAAAAPTCSAADDPEVPAAEVEAILGQERIELIDLFALADLASPILAAARSDVAASTGRLGRRGWPRIHGSGSRSTRRPSTISPTARRRSRSSSPCSWGGRRGPAEDARSRELEASRQLLDDARRDVRGRIHALLVEILHGDALARATNELIEEASRTHEIARKRFEARAAPESQVTRALLERYELELQRDRTQSDLLRAVEELRALLGGVDVPRDRFVAPAPLVGLPGASELVTRLLASHPGVAAARLEAEAAAARHRQTRAARLPDLEVRAAYGWHVARDEGFVEAGIDVALPLFNRNQGRIDEARAMLQQAEHNTRRLESELTAELAVVSQRRTIVARQLTAHRETIEPAAVRGLEQARAGYRASRLPFLELLDAQRTLARVRTRTLGLEREHALATAELSRLAGLGPYQD